MTDLREMIERERLIAFDKARAIITHVRYGEHEMDEHEIAREVFVARITQWNAAAVYRWKLRQLDRPTKGLELVA